MQKKAIKASSYTTFSRKILAHPSFWNLHVINRVEIVTTRSAWFARSCIRRHIIWSWATGSGYRTAKQVRKETCLHAQWQEKKRLKVPIEKRGLHSQKQDQETILQAPARVPTLDAKRARESGWALQDTYTCKGRKHYETAAAAQEEAWIDIETKLHLRIIMLQYLWE